jgi:hypothetical protein
VRFILVDEISFISCQHFNSMSTCAILASTALTSAGLATVEAPFGRFNVVCTGDFMQHPPVKPQLNPPLYSPFASIEEMLKANDKRSKVLKKENSGREVWRSFRDVVFLRVQHRVSKDEDGKRLLDLQNLLESEFLSKADVSQPSQCMSL